MDEGKLQGMPQSKKKGQEPEDEKTATLPQQKMRHDPSLADKLAEAVQKTHENSLEDSQGEIIHPAEAQEISPEDALEASRVMSLDEKLGTGLPCQLSINLGKEALHTLVFDKDLITIGRDSKCDVVIDNLGASRVHAQIERLGRFYLLRDLSSKTGTFVHGKKIEEYSLNSGEEIFLAKHTLIFQKLSSMRWHQDEVSKSSRPQTKGISKQQMMQTMAVDFRDMAKKQGPAAAHISLLGSNRRTPLTKNVIFFGKSPKCDYTVAGFLISERHAVMVLEDKGYMLYHLGLFKPPAINNKPVISGLVENGDLVQVGDLQFILQLSEQESK